MYNRGVAKQPIFRRAADRRMFLECFARHLGPNPAFDQRGRPYRHLRSVIAVSAYCLMPNHFHLIVRAVAGGDGVSRLMRSATTAYAGYFNRLYDRPGPLFQGTFNCKPLRSTEAVMRATAYVHLNHKDGPDYRWSSHQHYVEDPVPVWLDVRAGLGLFGGREAYNRFIVAEQATRQRLNNAVATPNTWHDLAQPKSPE